MPLTTSTEQVTTDVVRVAWILHERHPVMPGLRVDHQQTQAKRLSVCGPIVRCDASSSWESPRWRGDPASRQESVGSPDVGHTGFAGGS
jgi:hypothetical protein